MEPPAPESRLGFRRESSADAAAYLHLQRRILIAGEHFPPREDTGGIMMRRGPMLPRLR
jgi:hypothetical protein